VIAAGKLEFRLEFDGVFVGDQRFPGSEQGLKRPAQVVPELVILRVQRQGSPIDGNGPLEVVQFAAGVAQGVMGVGRLRIDRSCVPEPLCRFRFLTGLVQHEAQEIGRFAIRGYALQ
jgi:hypothetical protein